MKCEYCDSTIEVLFGSHRFCTVSCARKFASNLKRAETNKKISNSLKGRVVGHASAVKGKITVPLERRICKNPNCSKEFLVKRWRKKQYCNNTCSAYRNGGLRPNAGKKGSWYFCSYVGKKVYLDSTWEREYAEWLDRNNVLWERPQPFTWVDDSNKSHKYYPDFKLIESGVYVDIKNDYLIVKDKLKIESVEKQNNVSIQILSRKDLDKILASVI